MTPELTTTPERLLAFLRGRAARDGLVEDMTRAEAAAAIDGTRAALANALSRLVVTRAVQRLEGRAAEGMVPRLRILDPVRFPAGMPPTVQAGQSRAEQLGIETKARKLLTGGTISLAKVRWAEASA